ncbi:unnamed protein product [Chilo suppressalis]|uniref:BTB domain-containing protein n=1 Tax=Chilo suppressalis TaxID=168631 RepID=A0ABN8B6L1_CHISP|nr:unnamed protein product [Chilo suppressalis]
MEASKLIQTGNSLKIKISIKNSYTNVLWTTKEFIMNAAAVFQVKVFASKDVNTSTFNNLIFVRFVKLHKEDNLTYIIKVQSKELSITCKNFKSDDDTWHLVQDNIKSQNYSFIVTAHIDISPSACPLALLHDDTELTDFELKGEDGSISIHRAVLAAASPVLKAMLSGKWRESTDGKMDKLDTSKAALQNLKDYLYLGTLPKVILDLEQLLLLASYYMIKDLEQKCVFKLVSMITAVNACDLLEMAGQHKVKQLQLAILECVEEGVIKVDDIRNHSQTLDCEAGEESL